MNNFLRVLAVGIGVLSLGKMIAGQPAFCTEDSQCNTGFYCEETLHTCHECVRCEDLKRVTPLPLMSCVKSVLDCGVCLKGYFEDLRMDRACILLSERTDGTSGGSPLPPYAWALIVLSLLVVLIIISIYIFKKETLFSYICKIRTSTHASVHNRCSYPGGVGGSPGSPASAPPAHEPPPAYQPYYVPVRPGSPGHISEQNALSEVASVPLIKRTPHTAALGARECSDSQAAQPFNNPSYVRGPATRFGGVEESEPASPFQPHDEDTMESFWSPNETANDNINSSHEDAAQPAALAPRAGEPAAAPPRKVARLTDESNNNSGGGGGASVGASGGAGGGAGPPQLLVNVSVTNILNNLEQRNTLNLPKL